MSRSQSFAQQRSPAASAGINSSPSANTDNEEEDSMHEKYFSPNVLSMHGKKSMETTPLVSNLSFVIANDMRMQRIVFNLTCSQVNRRKHHSETSSPSVSSGGGSLKANTPDYVNFVNPPPPPSGGTQTASSLTSHSSSSNSSTLASFSKHHLPLLKSK